MDWEKEFYDNTEKPLDRLVDGYSNTSIFRTIAVVGDSLSSGEFELKKTDGKPEFYDLFDYSWGQYIARKNGLKAYNFSRGGMTAREYVESYAEEKGFWDKDKMCQAYIIALGVNDIYNNPNMEIGNIRDIDENDYKNNKPTFLGYYAQIVKRYKDINPDAKFFFVTFPNSDTPERDDRTHGMINALYALADYFENAYVIDLYKYGPVYNWEFEEKFFLNSHMNPSGYILTARIIDSYIDYIIRHNPADFNAVWTMAEKERLILPFMLNEER